MRIGVMILNIAKMRKGIVKKRNSPERKFD